MFKHNPSFLVFCFSLLFSIFTNAQNCADTLYLKDKKCYKNNKRVTHFELGKLLNTSPELKVAFTKYNNTVVGDVLISSIAGFGIGYGIAPFLFPISSEGIQNVHIASAAVGFVFLVWSFSLEDKKYRRLQAAMDAYNKKLLATCAGNP